MPSSELDHVRELVAQWQTLHLATHHAEEHARGLALEEINRRLGEMNELRAQLNQERGHYVLRDWLDKVVDTLQREVIERYETNVKDRELLRAAIGHQIDDIQKALKAIETTMANYEGRIWMLGALLSALVIGMNLVFRYWK